jgi:hypothetical protein
MARTAERLQRELGVPVSINPLPSARLRHPGRSLLPWKVRLEGRVLGAPAGFDLNEAPGATEGVTEVMRTSYAISGLLFLLEDLRPPDLARRTLPPQQARAVRKALRHAVQLTLLRTGRYAPTLDGALALLDKEEGAGLRRLAAAFEKTATWFEVRDLLIDDAVGGRSREGLPGTLLRNVQFAALSAMRRRGIRPRALLERRRIGGRLEEATALLATAIGPRGEVDAHRFAAAARALPDFLRPRDPSWPALRDVVVREWPQANPLLGL